MCSLDRYSGPKTMISRRNDIKQCYDGLAGKFIKLSVGKTEEKRVDVASLVATTVQ